MSHPVSRRRGEPLPGVAERRRWLQGLIALLWLVLTPSATAEQRKDPRVPPGRDPGGVAVALLSSGIDYTVPEIANRLARDGEGEIIAWDFIDNDNRPFDATGGLTPPDRGGDATGLVAHMANTIARSGVRIVLIRVDPADPATLARGVAFVSRTPARVVAVPMWSDRIEDWELFRQAASHFQQLLFVVAAGDGARDIDREPIWPAAFKLPNVLVVTSAMRHGKEPNGIQVIGNRGVATVDAAVSVTDVQTRAGTAAASLGSRFAVAEAAGYAACLAHMDVRADGATLKQKVLASGRPADANLAVRRDLTTAVCVTRN
jgi:subtilisin family serine protease